MAYLSDIALFLLTFPAAYVLIRLALNTMEVSGVLWARTEIVEIVNLGFLFLFRPPEPKPILVVRCL